MRSNSPSEIQENLNLAHGSDMTWREVAAPYGVNVRYVYDFAIHGKEPKSLRIRRAFGLSPICPSCSRRIRPALPDWMTTAADWLAAREVTFGVKDRMNITT